MQYQIGPDIISYQCQGAKAFGQPKVLLEQAMDLTRGCSWHALGYTVAPFLNEKDFNTLHDGCTAYLNDVLAKLGGPTDSIELSQYHTFIGEDYTKHLKIIDQVKVQARDALPIDMKLVEERISELCQEPLEAKNPFDGAETYHYRIIRPQSGDNNPLHRDVWLEDYDDCINLYVPLTGSSPLSSLPLIPGSHLWSEALIEKTLTGAKIGETQFNVPAVTAIDHEFDIIRPDPHRNEVLVFSPYLIHGGAVNLTTDSTRISLEIRLWRKKNDTK